MAENWSTNTRYPPAVQNINHFMPMINPIYHDTTYRPILAQSPNQTYNMLENMTSNSCQWPFKRAEFLEHDDMNYRGRLNFETATFYIGKSSSMEEERFVNNNGSYVGYRGNHYSNQYYPVLHNHENFLYESYSDEGKPSLEDLVNEFVNESSKRSETSLDDEKPYLEDLCGEFVTTFSRRMEYNEQKLDVLELHMVYLRATMKNFEVQMCQIATAVNVRARENFVDEDDDEIESTPTYDELFPSEHEEGRNDNEEEFNFNDDICKITYPQYSTQLLLEFQSNQALETFKKLPSNNCFVDIGVVAHEEDLKRKRIENLDKWRFNEQEPSGMENCASVARGQHEDLYTMGWSIDNIIGETPIVTLDLGVQCKRRVKPKYTRYYDPP